VAIGGSFIMILVVWALNVIHILWVIGEKPEQYIGERIDRKIYHKQKQLREEINGDY